MNDRAEIGRIPLYHSGNILQWLWGLMPEHKKRMIKAALLAFTLAVFCQTVRAETSFNANFFTHFEAYQSSEPTTMDDLKWGESAIFITGRLGDRWSFLSEMSLELPKYRDRTVRVERLRVRYDLNRDNWVIFGKFHTPVNYWNDNFHHGRLFFPTINRPLSFNRFIPIHESGLRFAGKDLFGSNIGYDVVLGTGQTNGDDVFEDGVQSYTATLNWSPSSDLRMMASYYRDAILDHKNNPYHSHNHDSDMRPTTLLGGGNMGMGHADTGNHPLSRAAGDDLSYELMSYSLFWRSERLTTLTELSMNRTDDGDFNQAAYQYVGYHINEDVTVYGLFDLINVSSSEIHFQSGREARYGMGVEYALGLNTTLKVELRRRDDRANNMSLNNNEIQAQLSFGF